MELLSVDISKGNRGNTILVVSVTSINVDISTVR